MLSSILVLALSLQASGQDPVQDRVADLEKKVQELEKRQAQTTSANPLTALNPTVTVIGNFLWRLDNRDVATPEGDEIDDTANVREVELDFRSAIDPYADAVAIIALESELPGEYEIGVEEFLIQVKSLPVPFWDYPPLGTKVKLGRMRTEFGRNNRLHLHDLPQSNRPLTLEDYLGEEGHVANGLSVQCFLPSPGDTALELTLQALQGGDLNLAQESSHPCFLANLRLFVPVADEHSADLSAILFYGTNDDDGHRQSRVLSLDFLYRWKPLRQGESRSLLVGAQAFLIDHEFPFTADVDTDADGVPDTTIESSGSTRPFGYFAWTQVQVAKSLYLGLRWDDAEFLTDDDLAHQRIQPYVSWYVSEFFRVRGSFEHTFNDGDPEDGLNTVLLEVNVIFGAHPPEPFWVNR